MADRKISALTAATTPLAGTEVFPVVQSATTKRTALSTIKDYILGIANTFTANQTIQTTGSTASKITVVSDLDGGSDYQSNFEVRRSTVAAGARWKSKRNTGTGGVGWVAQVTTDNAAETSGTYTDAIEITNDGNLKISTAGKGIYFAAGIIWITGAGSPEGLVTAVVGSLYTRTDGGANTTLYVKQSGTGNTGWAAK